MRYLKKNTDQYVTVGPFIDETAGIVLEDALTVTSMAGVIAVSTHAAASTHTAFTPDATAANDWGMVAIGHGGLYDLKIPDSEINFVGSCKISIWYAASSLPVWEEFMVVPANVWDSLMGTDLLDVNAAQWLGTAILAPGTAGTPDVNAKLIGATAQTGRDIGLSVLLSSGTGAGQLNFTSGVVQSNLVQILAAAITGTAAQIVAAFTKFFNVAAPTATCLSLPDAVPGAAGGAFIAGTNAATTVTTALTTTFTGNLTGTTAKSPATLATADVTGNLPANVCAFLGTAITETAGLIAAAFTKFFNKATPTGTVNSLPDAVAGASGGVAIVGSVMGKSAATLAAGDVSGNLPSDVKAWNGGAVPTVGDATAANQSTILGYIDTEVAAILAAVDTEVAAIKSDTAAILLDTAEIGAAGAGLTSIPNSAGVGTLLTRVPDVISLVAINAEVDTALNTAIPGSPTSDSINERVKAIDDLTQASGGGDLAALKTTVGAAGAGLTSIPNSAGVGTLLGRVPDTISLVAINAEVDTALTDIHLDHLLAADYDPAAKPGTATALLNELIGSDAGVSQFTANALELAPTGGSAPTVAQIADGVWDEVLHTDHEVGGSASVLLQAAGTAADPWLTPIPGAYGAGTAGKILGDNINAPIATVDTVVDGIATTLGVSGAGLTAIPTVAAVTLVTTATNLTNAPTAGDFTATMKASLLTSVVNKLYALLGR